MRLKKILKENKRTLYFIGVMLAIFLVLTAIQPLIFSGIQKNPDMFATYKFILEQLDNKSMIWLFIICFLGSLIFITVPSDIIFTYYIIGGANPGLSILFTWLGVSLGRAADYWIGYIFSGFVTKKILKNEVKNYNKKFVKWGDGALFFGNFLFFFPMEFFITFIGTIRFSFYKTFLYNAGGKLAKLLIVAFFFKYLAAYNVKFLNIDVF